MRRFPALAVAALALASCSAGDDDGGAATGDDAPTASSPAGSELADSGASELAADAPEAAADVPAESAESAGELPQEDPVDDGISVADSCDALTDAEIGDATGLPFASGAPSTIADAEFQDACDWVSSDGLTTAQLIIVDTDVFAMNRTSADEVSEVVDVDVPGTDEAYSTFGGSIVGMRYGERFVQFAVIGSDGVDRSQAVLDLAALAVSRL
jgi:hypothetical protein